MRLLAMKMKQISDTTLKITMSLEDLMDRGMEIADFLVPQEKTSTLSGFGVTRKLNMPVSRKLSGISNSSKIA